MRDRVNPVSACTMYDRGYTTVVLFPAGNLVPLDRLVEACDLPEPNCEPKTITIEAEAQCLAEN